MKICSLNPNHRKENVLVKRISGSQHSGLAEFKKRFSPKMGLVVGEGGMRAEEFLSCNPKTLF